MDTLRLILARSIRFVEHGLQGPTNEQAREILEQRLSEAEARRSSEVTGLGQQLAEAVAQRDEARGSLDAVSARLADHLYAPLKGGRVPDVLRSIDTLAQRVKDARADYREHDAALEAAVERAEKAEAQLRLRVQVGDIVVRNSADASKVEALRERIRKLEADLTAARARIAELEAPLPEATVEELQRVYDDAHNAASAACRDPVLAIAACNRAGIRAVAERVRRERCLVARAVAGGVDLDVREGVDDGKWGVHVIGRGCGAEHHADNVPAAEVHAELARMLTEVGA